MILGLLGALVIILVAFAMAYAISLAITFWFIALPLFIVWFWWLLRREKKRVRKPLSPQAQKSLDKWRAENAAAKRWREHEKAERRGY